MFTLPAVSLKIHAAGDYNKLLTPWLHEEQESSAVLTVFATVARVSRNGTLQTGYHDFTLFLDDVLAGRRGWYPPGTPDLPRPRGGAWVRHDDLEQARQRRAASEAARAREAAETREAAAREAAAALAVAAVQEAAAREALVEVPSPMPEPRDAAIEPAPARARHDEAPTSQANRRTGGQPGPGWFSRLVSWVRGPTGR